MKYLILTLSILLILSSYAIRLLNNFPTDDPDVFPLPFEHKSHKHEHEGLACCPCGGCHKHEDGKKELPEEITLWERLLSTLLSISIILTY